MRAKAVKDKCDFWEQGGLFDQPPEVKAEDSLERLEEAMRENASESVLAKMKALRPDGFWNGKCWSLPEDVAW